MARFVDILCMANSRKQGGRCIAGLDLETGEWIRPVRSGVHGELDLSDCRLDTGNVPGLLDIIRVPLANPAPEPHQPENWLIASGAWKFCGTMEISEARGFLDSVLTQGPELFGDRSDRIDRDEIEANPLEASLAVIRVVAPTFEVNHWNSFRARFTLKKYSYDLGFTDLSAWAVEARKKSPLRTNGEWYLTISLTEPFQRDNQCYKVAAAGLDIGNSD